MARNLLLPFLGIAFAVLFPAATALNTTAFVVTTCDAKTVVPLVCADQPVNTFCFPCDPASFVKCDGKGQGIVKKCPKGTAYDYLLRTCITGAVPCDNVPCPPRFGATLPGQKLLSNVTNSADVTINLAEEGSFWVICSVGRHCSAGMVFKVTVRCPAEPINQGYTGTVHLVEGWEETMGNPTAYPARDRDIVATCGDMLHISWDDPMAPHQVAVVKEPRKQAVGYIPYPPQPVYKCPDFEAFNSTDPAAYPPGMRLLAPLRPSGNLTLANFTKEQTLYPICQLGNHCRMGMVFKLSVVEGPEDYAPAKYAVPWTMLNRNYPDMTLRFNPKTLESDSLTLSWSGMHGVVVADELEAYFQPMA